MRDLVADAADLAFDALDDLAVDVLLIRHAAASFNFSTGAVSAAEAGRYAVKGVVLEDDSNLAPAASLSKKLIVRSSGVPLDGYDTAQIAGVEWAVAGVVKDDGFTTELVVYKRQ